MRSRCPHLHQLPGNATFHNPGGTLLLIARRRRELGAAADVCSSSFATASWPVAETLATRATSRNGVNRCSHRGKPAG
jgi:hypothetical protein